jgi:hypothetical protein
LSKDLTIIGVMRRCIVPLAILHPLHIFCRWYGMELGEFNLPLLKKQIKYLIDLSDIKVEFLWFFLTKGTRHFLLAFDPTLQVLSYCLHLLNQSNPHKTLAVF